MKIVAVFIGMAVACGLGFTAGNSIRQDRGASAMRVEYEASNQRGYVRCVNGELEFGHIDFDVNIKVGGEMDRTFAVQFNGENCPKAVAE